MASNRYSTGDILTYPYLWEWQHLRGETEGRKERPCCLALIAPQTNGQTRLYLLPITTTPPSAAALALAVPAIEAHRANLERGKRQWVVLGEWNSDILEASYYLDQSAAPHGRFSKPFMNQLIAALRKALQSGELATIRRDD